MQGNPSNPKLIGAEACSDLNLFVLAEKYTEMTETDWFKGLAIEINALGWRKMARHSKLLAIWCAL